MASVLKLAPSIIISSFSAENEGGEFLVQIRIPSTPLLLPTVVLKSHSEQL